MSRLTRLLIHYRHAITSLGAVAALIALVGGIAFGVERASIPQPAFQTQQTSARLPAARHSVVGEVRAVGTSELLVRGPKGALFAIRWGPAAQFRTAGRPIAPSELRPGDKVVVIGRPAADGSLNANRITVTPPKQVSSVTAP